MVVDTRSLAAQLGSRCASWRALDPGSDAALAVDGLLPPLWCEPATAVEVSAVLELANVSGAAVLPRGGGSRMGLGQPPRAADLLLSTRGLNQVIEYEPADLTVTVEAGLGLDELQALLNSRGQFLALDPPSQAVATVGGLVASNASGPLRLQYGSARDIVIGMRIANSDGVLTKAGGRVVKNVAGYDLNKLYTGSLGTLGVIVELSFKLHPLPQTRGTVLATFDDLDAAATVVKRVMHSPLGPAALEVLGAVGGGLEAGALSLPASGCALAVLVGGFEPAVRRVSSEIAGFCREGGRAEVLAIEDSEELWTVVRGLADASEAARPVLKVSVPPSRSVDALARLRAALDATGFSATLVAHAGTGLAYAKLDATIWDEAALDRLASAIRELRTWATQQEGSLVVECGPLGLKQRLDVWGEIGPSLRLMKALKDQLDPRGTLNPGRFVGGI
jgi:glycolate dehydrogenase FAD-binding subunit